MAEDERDRDDEEQEADEVRDRDDDGQEQASEQDVTKPGEWERQPGDEEEMRHDDGVEPPADPDESSEEDEAEQEAGDAGGSDEGFDRPDTADNAELEDTGTRLGEEAEPLLEGPEVRTPIGPVPTRSLVGMGAFIVAFCVGFFILWALIDDAFGIFLGLVVGTALGLAAVKLFADRSRTAG